MLFDSLPPATQKRRCAQKGCMPGVLLVALSWLLCLRRRGASCQVLGSRGRPREAEVRLLPSGWVLTKLCGRAMTPGLVASSEFESA